MGRRPKPELPVVLGGSPELFLRHGSHSPQSGRPGGGTILRVWCVQGRCAGAHALLLPVSVSQDRLAIPQERLQVRISNSLFGDATASQEPIFAACFVAVVEVFWHPRRHGAWRAVTRQRSPHRKAQKKK